ncbi:UNVERIFIED_CONTAM: hypothetical protein K2H54_023809 [Gekko kuhli]
MPKKKPMPIQLNPTPDGSAINGTSAADEREAIVLLRPRPMARLQIVSSSSLARTFLSQGKLECWKFLSQDMAWLRKPFSKALWGGNEECFVQAAACRFSRRRTVNRW